MLLQSVPDTMGSTTLREYCTFFWINYKFGRTSGEERILQHGSTTHFPLGLYEMSEAIAKEKFPFIENKKFYGAIFPGGRTVSFFEEDIYIFM